MRALRPVFLTFREPFPQAEYNMTRPGGLREALTINAPTYSNGYELHVYFRHPKM